MLDLLAFKATDVPATNLTPNGDYSKNDGVIADGVSIGNGLKSEIVELDDGSEGLKVTVEDPESLSRHGVTISYRMVETTEKNDIMYVASEIRTNIEEIRVSMYAGSVPITQVIENNHDFIQVYGNKSDSFEAGINNIYVSNNDGELLKDDYVIFNKHITINLTKTFGKGNEPSAEQMNNLLEQFPNSWFDGTKNLFNAKEFMNNYHKKTKELENAIISLGGELP